MSTDEILQIVLGRLDGIEEEQKATRADVAQMRSDLDGVFTVARFVKYATTTVVTGAAALVAIAQFVR